MGFVKFMVSDVGRMARVVAGVVLIALGLLALKDTVGTLLAVVGLVPLLAGVFDVCVFAPLFGEPFSGKEVRAKA